MRNAILALLVGVPGLAAADVWQDRVVYPEFDGGFAQRTTSSKILYLNDCMPAGCTVRRGQDSSINNMSSIPSLSSVTLDAYAHGKAHWDDVVACVRATMAPFDIEVVTEDPGTTSHYEVMVGGTASQLRDGLDAGGIAPFLSCGAARDNVLVFVFASQTSSKPYLCAAIAHEAGHAYGLSHSLDALDPMTYKDLGGSKSWQNSDAQCGTDSPQPCRCTGATQNTFRYLHDVWGLHPSVADASATLYQPRDGAWVRPHFPITGKLESSLPMLDAEFSIDGTQLERFTAAPLAINAPELPAGTHTVSLAATDFGDRTVTASATVHVMATCTAAKDCDGNFHCYDGVCMPNKQVAGGFGASCTANDECVTGSCASDGSQGVCTGRCDAETTCPSGFGCTAEGVCWPNDSGGCSTTNGSPGLLALGLGALVLGRRRRRQR
jgi:MYXO-CTERM domain-containing protein